MPVIIDGQTIHEQITLDGLSRVAAADDGSVHVLYLDSSGDIEIIRSMLAADWPPPLPTNPTPQQISDAIASRSAQDQIITV